MDVDAPLDFETEDLLLNQLGSAKKRSKRVIGLDDLVDDFYAEKSKNAKAEVKRANVRKRAISDDDDYHERDKEALLPKFVDECEKQVKEIVTEEEIPSWGLRVFGRQDNRLQLSWVPSYLELKDALEVYGYLWTFVTCNQKNDAIDRAFDGPPRNLRLLLKVIAACCQSRIAHTVFSVAEVENLLGVVISFFLEHRLEGILLVLQECMLSVLSFFTDDEWELSSKHVAETIAGSIQKDLNCIRVVECISGLDMRSKHFRRELAYHLLIKFLNYKGDNAE